MRRPLRTGERNQMEIIYGIFGFAAALLFYLIGFWRGRKYSSTRLMPVIPKSEKSMQELNEAYSQLMSYSADRAYGK